MKQYNSLNVKSFDSQIKIKLTAKIGTGVTLTLISLGLLKIAFSWKLI